MAYAASKKTILILGANGYVARLAYQALKDLPYQFKFIDNKKVADPYNRFSLEKVALTGHLSIPEDFIELDLTDQKKFAAILNNSNIICVINFAGVLENQNPEDITKINNALTMSILTACSHAKIPLITMSSVMIMYGLAIDTPEINAAFKGKAAYINPSKRITETAPTENRSALIKKFNPDITDFLKNLAYIHSKEFLEIFAQKLCSAAPHTTIITVRLGWLSIKSPYLLEDEPPYTETTVALSSDDFMSFIKNLTLAVLNRTIQGYDCFSVTSNHPQNWISLDRAKCKLGWIPKTDIAPSTEALVFAAEPHVASNPKKNASYCT